LRRPRPDAWFTVRGELFFRQGAWWVGATPLISEIAKRIENPLNISSMPTVAEQLRIGREAKGLTVDQIANMTKIRTDHVRALEEGNYNVFPAPIYIRGSVKLYANALKLDAVTLLAELNAELKGTQKLSEPPPLAESRKTIVDHFTLLLAKLNWKVGFAGIGIIAAVAIAVCSFLAWQHHQKHDPLKSLPPAVYQPARAADNTLPLPKR
jgi:cytoskeletal protein RodZ